MFVYLCTGGGDVLVYVLVEVMCLYIYVLVVVMCLFMNWWRWFVGIYTG